ncbi:Ig heavy chain Mem5-like isoform X2 [Protopterus annectens]|uniref:Ig heavy chain Mem5-like isoform X2 n=1 Tax=Protopterus annectens TaxID=7888 RepID=UPI001CFAB19A|nr:Ig heavy chain Mem5-like isoform X2 [Protopterus annectens]
MEASLVILFLTLLSYSFCATSLSQSPLAVTVVPGETVTISCIVEGDKNELMNLHWYRQTATGVQYFPTDSHITANRFVPSQHSSISNLHFLTITSITDMDKGTYYCALSHPVRGSLVDFVQGEGSSVHVEEKPESAPTIQLHHPSKRDLSSGNIEIICIINGFEHTHIFWTVDDEAPPVGVSAAPPTLEKELAYTKIFIPVDLLASYDIFTCTIKRYHNSKIP